MWMTNITRKRSNSGIRCEGGCVEGASSDLSETAESAARLPRAIFLIAGLGLWLLSHPYWGIWHDARVYTLMALHWLSPSNFVRDPWFMFGSQDTFTLFSPLYGSAIATFGIDSAAKWGTLLAGACYVVAAWFFSRCLPIWRARSLLFLLLVSLQLVYSVNDFGLTESFRLSESFITSRQYSIAFALTGLALAISGRRFAIPLVLGISTVLHPLMGIWAVLVCVAVLLPIRCRVVLVLAVLTTITLIALSISGWGPFRLISGEWARLVRGSALIVFVAPDGSHRLEFVLVCYALLGCGIRWGQQTLKRWYQVVLIVSGSAYLVSWFCSEYFPAAIVMQAQLWRANWLALVFAMVAALELAAVAFRADRPLRDLAVISGGLLVLFPFVGVASLIVSALLANSVQIRFVELLLRQKTLILNVIRWLAGVTVLAVFAQLSMSISEVGSLLWRAGDSIGPVADFVRGLLFTGGYGLLALGFWWFGSSCRWRFTFLVVSTALIIGAAMQWDDRKPQRRLMDEHIFGATNALSTVLFSGLVHPGKTVYWQGAPERVWYELRTASYVSSTQAIGIVFSERMTLEVARRLARVSLAGSPLPIPETITHDREEMVRMRNLDPTQRKVDIDDLHTYEAQKLTRDGLEFICKDPELDYVIHRHGLEHYVLASAEERVGGRATRWNLYSCAHLRVLQSGMSSDG